MQSLQPVTRFRCWILAWLVLSLGAATAAPLIQPQKMLDAVCSMGGALKLVLVADSAPGRSHAGSADLQCPQCLFGGAPVPAVASFPHWGLALASIPSFHPVPWALVAHATRPPARAPPVFL